MRELVLDCPEALADSLSDALLECGALSVSVEDADEGTALEKPLFGEPGMEPESHAWEHNRMVVLVADGDDPMQLLSQASAQIGLTEDLHSFIRDVPDADWVRLTQSQFAPIAVNDHIWIVPTWHEVPSEASNQVLIRLDPGLAFGTGSHPTTHLCLAWLDHFVQAGQDVLDYGCGSGILAIAAKMLGAQQVVGIDIDPQAVVAAEQNAEMNNVDVSFGLPDVFQAFSADVVVANILSNPLKMLAPMLCARVRPGGHLILSGVLERQALEVAAVYQPWIQLSVWRTQEGWVCLHGQRKV